MDVIQSNAPHYDLDIDGEPDPTTDVQSPNAESAKEDTPTGTSKPEDHVAIPLTTNRPEHQPSEVSADTDHTEYDSSKQPRADHPSDYHTQLEDIPELETEEEKWDNGQFDDVEPLNHYNSTEESNRMCHEYSAYFEKVKDQEYSPYHITQAVEYEFPELDYCHTDHNQNSTTDIKTKMCYIPPRPSIEDLHTWYG